VINDVFGFDIAKAVDGRTIEIRVPQEYSNRLIEFMSAVENARVEMDNSARVVLNERTGTVVLGKDVSVSGASIIHGTLKIQVGTTFNVSQPNPRSQGLTAIVPEETLTVSEEPVRTVTIRDGESVEELVRALYDIGATPRDVIAILQAIKAQGALQADLEIL
jgi:flagellar P-ring protein precursor FlgI